GVAKRGRRAGSISNRRSEKRCHGSKRNRFWAESEEVAWARRNQIHCYRPPKPPYCRYLPRGASVLNYTRQSRIGSHSREILLNCHLLTWEGLSARRAFWQLKKKTAWSKST